MQTLVTVILTGVALYFLATYMRDGHMWLSPVLIVAGFAWAWRMSTPAEREQFKADAAKLIGRFLPSSRRE